MTDSLLTSIKTTCSLANKYPLNALPILQCAVTYEYQLKALMINDRILVETNFCFTFFSTYCT